MTEAPEVLRRCLDAKVMAAAFAQHLPQCLDGTFRVKECRVEHPRYKRYRSAPAERSFVSALYRLQVETSQCQLREVLLTGWAYMPAMAASEYRRLRGQNDATVHWLAELGFLYRLFPDDPALPWLRDLVSPAYLQQRLVPEGSTATSVTWAVVNYRPSLRCTLRYQTCDAKNRTTVYVKTFADPSAQKTYERMRQIDAQRCVEAFVTPAVLRYDPTMLAVWMAGLHGDTVQPETAAAEQMRAVGRGLAALHGVTLSDLPHLTQADYCAEALKKLHKLLRVCPQHKASLHTLEQRLLQPPVEVKGRTLHGDFHHMQLLQTAEGIALFDYDELQCGDPLIDIANFIAAIVNLYGTSVAEQWQSELLQGYLSVATWPVCEARLRWHLSIQLLTRAYRAFIQQRHDLSEHLERLLKFVGDLSADVEPHGGALYRYA